MIRNIVKGAAVLSLFFIAGPVSADTITGWSDPVSNTADFSWHVNSDGVLVVSVANTSDFTGQITGIQFDLGEDGSITELVDVDGTGRDRNWGHTTDARGCFMSDCMVTGLNFWHGRANAGIGAGQTGDFRFVGDFINLSQISNVIISFRGTGGNHRWWDGGFGCGYGCDPTDVPEPGTLILFGAGLLGLGLARRRKLLASRQG